MLSNLFNDLISYGRLVRSKNLNGLDYWNKIKKILLTHEHDSINKILTENWKINRIINIKSNYTTDNLSDIYTFVHDTLKMHGEEEDMSNYRIDHDLWSKYHFYLQLARIPKNNKLDLGRLLQVAYNLGQLSVHLNSDPIFTRQIRAYFELNNLNNINSYINLDEKKFNDEHDNILNNIREDVNKIIDVPLLGGFSKPFYGNLEKLTFENKNYRKVLYTGKHQLVLMNLKPNDFIKQEIHNTIDQFIRIEKGNGIAIIDGIEYELKDGIGLIIPAGSQHKIVNTSSIHNLSLYTIYSPPEHAEDVVRESNPDSQTIYLTNKENYESLKNKF